MVGVALERHNWPLTAAAGEFVNASIADNTRSAYASDWRTFTAWCAIKGVAPLPVDPIQLANFIAEQAESFRPATLERRIAAVNKAHSMRGHVQPGSHPAVKAVLAGVRRRVGSKQRRMTPLMLEDLRKVLGAFDRRRFPAGVASARDTCLLLFGFAGAFRRSELVALNVGDVNLHPSDGLHLTVSRSKTDQEGQSQIKALPYGRAPQVCAVCAYVDWVQLLLAPEREDVLRLLIQRPEGHTCSGDSALHELLAAAADLPLFPRLDWTGAIARGSRLSGQAVNDVVRRRLKAAGVNPTGFGAHSMRAGFITEAIRSGATDRQVMRQTGHKSTATIAVYDREQNPLRGNAVTRIGL